MLVLDGPPGTAIIYDVAFSPDGETIAACVKDGRLWLWGAALDPAAGYPGKYGLLSPQAARFRPNSDRVYVGLHDQSFCWHDVRTGETGGGYAFSAPVTGIAFVTPDLLAVGTGSRSRPLPGTFHLWDAETGVARPPVFHESTGVRAVAAHPESRTVAWATHAPRVSVWDITTASPIHLPVSHVSPSLAFHPDGQTLAAAVDYGVKLFDLPTRAERRTLKGHAGRVMSIAFSPDGRVLASGSWDGTVRLWDAATGTELARYAWPTGRVFALAYAPDGLRLAAAGDRGCVVVWDTE